MKLSDIAGEIEQFMSVNGNLKLSEVLIKLYTQIDISDKNISLDRFNKIKKHPQVTKDE